MELKASEAGMLASLTPENRVVYLLNADNGDRPLLSRQHGVNQQGKAPLDNDAPSSDNNQDSCPCFRRMPYVW
jgi:hypothetical protein